MQKLRSVIAREMPTNKPPDRAVTMMSACCEHAANGLGLADGPPFRQRRSIEDVDELIDAQLGVRLEMVRNVQEPAPRLSLYAFPLIRPAP